jgi:hypothetical protein
MSRAGVARVANCLGLPYRVVLLCSGDMGFGAAMAVVECGGLEIRFAGSSATRVRIPPFPPDRKELTSGRSLATTHEYLAGAAG